MCPDARALQEALSSTPGLKSGQPPIVIVQLVVNGVASESLRRALKPQNLI